MNLRHGHAIVEGRSRAYRIWGGMHTRCSNPNRSNWKYYGGAGIRVCERWSLFENFLRDMGEPPPGHSIDRIDPYGDYEPENCRWATPEVQARNQRRHASLGG